ncbi:MAG: hypothetical protein VX320_00115 [Candidatus Thermoplasmatota archaeon]|nr:hypothetical protein [Candidatus Thermoplasmatota archaeon]
MGEVEVVESGSLDGLTHGWEEYGARKRIMLLGARVDRSALRNHGRVVAIEESAVSVFHRPRAERADMEAKGIDHKISSFQFVDVALSDMGRWLQPLIGQGWTKGDVKIIPAEGASFEEQDWTCFHHPSIPLPEQIPLIESPTKMMRKAFVTHPGPILDDVIPSAMDEEVATSMLDSITQSMGEAQGEVEIETEEVESAEDIVEETEPVPIQIADEDIPPVPEPKVESPLEAELRQVISLLVAGGQEMGDIMEHPQFLEVSERASAAGVDVWGMFIKLSEEQ